MTTSTTPRARRAFAVWGLALSLGACGGGGGDPVANNSAGQIPGAAPSPAPTPSAAPSAAPAPAPASGPVQGGPLQSFGPISVATGIAVGAQQKQGAAASRLVGGGVVIAWSSGASLVLQRLDASGTAVGSAQTVGALATPNFQVNSNFSVAGTADAGWVVVWESSGQTLQFQRYDASGAAVGNVVTVTSPTLAQVNSVQVVGLAGGGFDVGWTAREGSTTATSRGFLQRFTSAGVAAGAATALSSSAGDQTSLRLSVLPDGGALAAWLQSNAGATTLEAVTRRVDASLSPVGSQTTLATLFISPPEAPAHVGSASLANGTTLLAWAQGSTIHWQLVGSDGVPTGGVGNATVQGTTIVDSIEVTPAASGFTVVVESTVGSNRSTTGFISVLTLNAIGGLTDRSELGSRSLWSANLTTGMGCGPAAPGVVAAGGLDGHYLLAYESCATLSATLEVLAR